MTSRTTDPATAEWRTNAVLGNLHLSRETRCAINIDMSSTSDLEKSTDNTSLYLPSLQLNRTNEPVAVSVPNARLQEQQNFVCPVTDGNHMQKFELPLKNKKSESLHQKNIYIQNEFPCHINEEYVNNNTQISKINAPEVNGKHMKHVSNVSQIDDPKSNLFKNLLRTQNLLYVPTCETSISLPLQSSGVQKPLLGVCHSDKGVEMSTDEKSPVLSCDMFDAYGNNTLDAAAFDELQSSDLKANVMDTETGEAVAQIANYFMGFKCTSSNMENDVHKVDGELYEKLPSQNVCSEIQPFTVTGIVEHLKECVFPHNKVVGSESVEMSVHEDESHRVIKEDIEMSENLLLQEAQFQSNEVTTLQKKQISVKSDEAPEIQGLSLESSIELKTHPSSKVVARTTPNQSHCGKEEDFSTVGEPSHEASCVNEKKHEDKFLKGRSHIPTKRKLKVQTMFHKREKTKSMIYSNSKATSTSKTEASSTVDIKCATVDMHASYGRKRRKTSFQIPFKKIRAKAKQVHKYMF
jgi:hypothetical protein